MAERIYDIVLHGATGYTGVYTAEYIASNFPTNLSWALAGRSRDKLSGLARTLKESNPDRKEPGIETAQLTDSDLTTLAKKTKLIINTVGPYCKYGEPVVKACAENGTHYVDVTGEAPWVKRMVEKYHEKAKETGAIIIPEIGVESSPADMITYALSNYIKSRLNSTVREIILTTHEMKMGASGGTLATVRELFNQYSVFELARASAPQATCPVSLPKYEARGMLERLFGYRSVAGLGTLTSSIQAASDIPIVYRSWGLLTLAGQSYGPNFRFKPYMTVRNALLGAAIHLALQIFPIFLLLRPVRYLLSKLSHAPGFGPDREASKKDWVEWRAIGTPDRIPDQVSDGKRAMASLKFMGSAYHLTGILLAEGAGTIVLEEGTVGRLGGGVLTPATLGQVYLERLERAGLRVEMGVVGGS